MGLQSSCARIVQTTRARADFPHVRFEPIGVQGRHGIDFPTSPGQEARVVATQILALYDRTALGDLAVETAFQVAREQATAALHVLAIPGVGDDAAQCDRLRDDLIAFTRIAQRYDIALDGAVIDDPSLERLTGEVRKRQINLLVIAKPEAPTDSSEIARLLEAISHATGIPTTVVHGGA